MSTAVAESQCLSLPHCEEELDEQEILEVRIRAGITCVDIRFSHDGGDFVWAWLPSQSRTLKVGVGVTITRTTLEDCLHVVMIVKKVSSRHLAFEYIDNLPVDLFEGYWRLDLVEEDYVLPRILDSILQFTQKKQKKTSTSSSSSSSSSLVQ